MTVSGRGGRILLGFAAVGALVGCGPSAKDVAAPARVDPVGTAEEAVLCDYLAVPIEAVRRDHLTFEGIVENPPGGDHGIGDMVALLYPSKGRSAGRFRPVLLFLTRRSVVATAPGHGRVPRASASVAQNARELDQFVADGGCR